MQPLEPHVDARQTRGTAQRIQLAAGFRSAFAPPAFAIGPLPAEVGCSYYGDTELGAVRCYRFVDATVGFDGIIVHDGETLFSEALNHPAPHVSEVAAHFSPGLARLSPRLVEGQAVLLTGPGHTTFGHWLADFLPRLFVLHECGYDIHAMRYIVPAEAPAFATELLATLGITEAQVVRYEQRVERLLVDDLVVPTNLRRLSRMHPMFLAAATFLLERVLRNAPNMRAPIRAPRIFIGRADWSQSRSMHNRESIERMAVADGFKVVRPELYPFAEQVAMFQQAEVIAGEYGSGLHGAVFARPGTVVCALRGTSFHPGWVQSSLGEVLGIPTGYVFGPTPPDAVHQTFHIDEGSFTVALAVSGLLLRHGRTGVASAAMCL